MAENEERVRHHAKLVGPVHDIARLIKIQFLVDDLLTHALGTCFHPNPRWKRPAFAIFSSKGLVIDVHADFTEPLEIHFAFQDHVANLVNAFRIEIEDVIIEPHGFAPYLSMQ